MAGRPDPYCEPLQPPVDIVAGRAGRRDRKTRVRPCGVVALPITNLYLQGHDGPGRGQRAIAPIGALRAGGVEVCAGADNLRDPFNPLGRADPLKRPRSV